MLTNIGGDFVDTVKYICPQSGIYMFSASLTNFHDDELSVDLIQNDKSLATLLCDGYVDLENNQCSATVVIQCAAGDTVRTKCNYSSCHVYGGASTNVFSGLFISNVY